jgi:hypothetical protein
MGLPWWFARSGLPFNQIYVPNPSDLASDMPMFVSVVPRTAPPPAALDSLGLDLGQAIIVVVVCFSALGLIGWYAAFSFLRSTSAVALAVLALTRHFQPPLTSTSAARC